MVQFTISIEVLYIINLMSKKTIFFKEEKKKKKTKKKSREVLKTYQLNINVWPEKFHFEKQSPLWL